MDYCVICATKNGKYANTCHDYYRSGFTREKSRPGKQLSGLTHARGNPLPQGRRR